MKQIPIRLGPVALVLTVISICLTVMAILTFSTAGADANMADAFLTPLWYNTRRPTGMPRRT